MKKEIKIKILQKPEPNRQSSFWFNSTVATLQLGNRIVSIEPQGEIRVKLKKNYYWEENENAREQAISLNLTDKNLDKISEWDGWGNNNWFEFYLTRKVTKKEWLQSMSNIKLWKGKIKEWLKYKNDFEEYNKDFSMNEWANAEVTFEFYEAIDYAKEILTDDTYWKH